MSQFRDTFTKEEQREPLLDYDDSAFLFYLCTVGFCTLAPWTFISVRRLLSPHRRLARLYPQKTRSGAVLLHCRCSLCNEKRAAEQQQQQHSSSRLLHALCRLFSFRRCSSEAAKSPAGAGGASFPLSSSSTSSGGGKGNSSGNSSSGSAAPASNSSSGSAKKKQQQQQQHTEVTGKADDEEERRSAGAAAAADAAATPASCSAAAAGSGGRRPGSAAAAPGSSNATAAGSNSNSPVRKRFKPRGTNWWEILEKLLLLLGWVGLATLCYNLPEMKNLKTFDPFEILELQVGASSRDVKKAYRLMSLRYHPDRNANDPTSAAKFILVSKAYQTLTDPTAKANYEKYGNPDGPRNMKVGMGLPRFLVEEKYQLLVLACFFLFLLVLLPMAFICYYQRQKKYAPNGVLVETLQFLTHYLTEGSRLKNCPEYLAASGESRAYKIEKADDKEMQPIIENAVEPKKRALNNPVIVRNYFLILGHMQRLHGSMSERLRDVLDDLLKDALPITHCMMEICVLSDWLHAARAILDFKRCLVQGLDGRASTLLQIPHFTAELVRHCHRGKNAVRELSEFLRQDPEARKGLLEMTPEEQLDVQAFAQCVSQMKLTASVSVEDEEEIVVGDIATCHIQLDRTNLKEGEAAGAVHAPLLPVPKYEEWWLFLVDKTEAAATGGRIVNFHRMRNLEKIVEEKIQFRVTKGGKQSLTVMALCDSYAGCDCSIDVEFRAYSPEEKPRDVWVHPDDVRLDEEPTLFQQMLGDIYDSSDEEEVFDLEEGSRVTVKKKPAEAPPYAPAGAAPATGSPAAAGTAAAAAAGTAAAAATATAEEGGGMERGGAAAAAAPSAAQELQQQEAAQQASLNNKQQQQDGSEDAGEEQKGREAQESKKQTDKEMVRQGSQEKERLGLPTLSEEKKPLSVTAAKQQQEQQKPQQQHQQLSLPRLSSGCSTRTGIATTAS